MNINNKEIYNNFILHIKDLIQILNLFDKEYINLIKTTEEEYRLLIESKIELIPQFTISKEIILENIKLIEQKRSLTIKNILNEINYLNIKIPELTITQIQTLLEKLNEFELLNELKNGNQLLLTRIENLKNLNKKNQIFINKFLVNIKKITTNLKNINLINHYDQSGKMTFNTR